MERVPGRKLLALARQVLSRTEIDRVIEPAIADLQHEWQVSARLTFSLQLLVRTRAYFGALRVIGPKLVRVGVRGALRPPRWSIVRGMVGPSLAFVTIIVIVSSFGPAAARTRDHWFFYLPDRILWHLPYIAMGWMPWPRSPLPLRLSVRASDFAKISAIVCACSFALSGWLAPLLREQYLHGLNLSELQTAGVHLWTLTELWDRVNGVPGVSAAMVASELHLRLLAPAFAIVCATLGWATVRATRLWNNAAAPLFSVAGLVTLIVFLRVGGFVTPTLSYARIAAEWATLAAIVALASVAIRMFARAERRRRSVLEARVLELLHAIAATRTQRTESGAHT